MQLELFWSKSWFQKNITIRHSKFLSEQHKGYLGVLKQGILPDFLATITPKVYD